MSGGERGIKKKIILKAGCGDTGSYYVPVCVIAVRLLHNPGKGETPSSRSCSSPLCPAARGDLWDRGWMMPVPCLVEGLLQPGRLLPWLVSLLQWLSPSWYHGGWCSPCERAFGQGRWECSLASLAAASLGNKVKTVRQLKKGTSQRKTLHYSFFL